MTKGDTDLPKAALSRRGAEIAARLERLPPSRFNWIVLSVGALAFLVEAMDTSIIAAVVKPIQTSLGLTPAQVGSLSVAAIFTTVIGVLLVGPLADKFGRKRMLVVGIPRGRTVQSNPTSSNIHKYGWLPSANPPNYPGYQIHP